MVAAIVVRIPGKAGIVGTVLEIACDRVAHAEAGIEVPAVVGPAGEAVIAAGCVVETAVEALGSGDEIVFAMAGATAERFPGIAAAWRSIPGRAFSAARALPSPSAQIRNSRNRNRSDGYTHFLSYNPCVTMRLVSSFINANW
ncbi:MAG: hypothetical protein LUE17_04660 [Planctomycetaceae bacterium]|nr:hypothetical protein [Planctomycetaceae bacterium]